MRLIDELYLSRTQMVKDIAQLEERVENGLPMMQVIYASSLDQARISLFRVNDRISGLLLHD